MPKGKENIDMNIELIVLLSLISIILLCMAFCGIMLIRNKIVYNARMKALNVSLEAYNKGNTYNYMLWDFRKWTYKQFYKDKENTLCQ